MAGIRERTGASIDINSHAQPSTITISGPAESIQAAGEEITALLNPSEETIHCDINRARDVIGPGGATVKEIQAQTGARVNINTRINPCSITIFGTQEALQAAGEIINGIMNPPSQVLSCDPRQVSEVIGRGGSTVNGIQDQVRRRIMCDTASYYTGISLSLAAEATTSML